MFDFLEKLRKKPENTRKKIVFAVTSVIVFIIFIFWLVATVWQIEHVQSSITASSSLSSDISNFVNQAKSAAPSVSF